MAHSTVVHKKLSADKRTTISHINPVSVIRDFSRTSTNEEKNKAINYQDWRFRILEKWLDNNSEITSSVVTTTLNKIFCCSLISMGQVSQQNTVGRVLTARADETVKQICL